MNYIIPAIATIIIIIGIKKKNYYLTTIGTVLNLIVWPNIPHTYNEYIYYILSNMVAIILGYNISNYL